MHTAYRAGYISTSPACLLKLPDDITDAKQTFTVPTPQGSRVKVYETLASEKKKKFRVSPSHCRVFFSLSALSLSLCVCTFKAFVETHPLCVPQTHTYTNMQFCYVFHGVSPLNLLQLSPDDADTLSKHQ